MLEVRVDYPKHDPAIGRLTLVPHTIISLGDDSVNHGKIRGSDGCKGHADWSMEAAEVKTYSEDEEDRLMCVSGGSDSTKRPLSCDGERMDNEGRLQLAPKKM